MRSLGKCKLDSSIMEIMTDIFIVPNAGSVLTDFEVNCALQMHINYGH